VEIVLYISGRFKTHVAYFGLAAVRRLAYEAADSGLVSPELAAGIRRVKGAKSLEFLLGHVSVQTTEKYLGCKQRLQNAIDDRIGIEPDC